MNFDVILVHYLLKLSFPPNLFTSSVIYHFIWCNVLFHKFVQFFVTILISLDCIGPHEEVFVAEYLQIVILIYQLAPCIYCVDSISSSKCHES